MDELLRDERVYELVMQESIPTRLLSTLAQAPVLLETNLDAARLTTVKLSDMERRVLTGYSHGLLSPHIADLYGISVQTVKSHQKAARAKLRSKTITHAVATAIRMGYID